MTKWKACEIYHHKRCLIDSQYSETYQLSPKNFKIESAKLAMHSGICVKCIRDIWNHKCWVVATVHLWRDQS